MRQVKIVLMGSGGVGKTSLTTQFVQEIFESSSNLYPSFVDYVPKDCWYEPTIEEMHRKAIEIDGEMFSLELLDTAGLDQFAQMRDVQIGEGEGFIIVYSITDKSTLVDAQMLHEEIVKLKSESVPLILVGNKRDLSNLREVSQKDGEDVASKWPDCKFFESSAKCARDAEIIFTQVARQIVNFQCKSRKDSKKSMKSQLKIGKDEETHCIQCCAM